MSAPDGAFRAGAAEADITPGTGVAMAGYSGLGRVARGAGDRLFARAVYLEDGRGERAAVCVLDLMSASRRLVDEVAALTGPACGIGADRLILAGTHTHHGPGHYFGDTLYGAFAQKRPGFDPDLTAGIARGAARAVEQAVRSARPARVGISTSRLWGVGKNASLPAFRRNPEASRWNHEGWPGAGAPPGLTPEQRAVDPRLNAVAVLARETGRPMAVLGTFACHNTAGGVARDAYGPDWFGEAVLAARGLFREAGAGDPVVCLLASAGGDVNALCHGEPQGPALVRRVGQRVGRALFDAAGAACRAAREERLRVRCAELRWDRRFVDGRADTELARAWCFGTPTLGGQEDGRSWLYRAGLVRAAMTGRRFPPGDPQFPKRPALGRLQPALRRLLRLRLPPAAPLHTLELGDLVLATVPGEPTVTVGHRVGRVLCASTGASRAAVVGYAGDYCGYVATLEEYLTQHYEGASTLYGRNVAAHIAALLERCVRS